MKSEILITQQMLDAGVEVFLQHRGWPNEEEVVEMIFMAMMHASPSDDKPIA